MSTFQIVRVRTERPWGASHDHIADVMLPNGGILSRSMVITDLRRPGGDRYFTMANGARAEVVVRGCPYCAFSDYITTLPDSTTSNNLLSLPRF